MDTFKDKVVLITGASSGIGACTAIEYAKRGAKLALTGRNEARLNGAREKCIEVGADPENVLLVLADLAVEAECLNFVEKAEEYFGRIDVLVNNAGHMLGGNIDKCSVEDMDLMYTVNVRSMFIITKRAIPHLEKSKGSIVNISSLAGDRPIHYAFAYAISKAAVTQFTKTLAQARGSLSLICLCGMAVSVMVVLKYYPRKAALVHPLQRVGQPEDVAHAILYLSSDLASFVTGTCLPVDGGRNGACNNHRN